MNPYLDIKKKCGYIGVNRTSRTSKFAAIDMGKQLAILGTDQIA